MATQKTVYTSSLGNISYKASNLGATPKNGISTGGATLFEINIDARQNPGEDVYFCAYNLASPTVGTSQPEIVGWCKAGKKQSYVCPRGYVLGTDLSIAATQEKSGSGTTNPSGIVDVELIFSD